jgi:hypothetical protein
MAEDDQKGGPMIAAAVVDAFLSTPQAPPVVDPAQFVALRTLVTAMLAGTAWQIENSRPGGAQAWINDVSVVCQDALLKADISIDGYDTESFRQAAIEHVNTMLKSVGLPDKRPNPDH